MANIKVMLDQNLVDSTEFQVSEELFHSILESLPVGIYRISPEGKLILANKILASMLGYDSLESMDSAMVLSEGFPPSVNNPVIRERLDKFGKIKGLETKWQKPDGTVMFVRENITAVKNNAGKIIYYDGIIENISEKMREAENFRKLSEAVEQSPVSIIVTDLMGKIEYVNPRACQTSGYSFKELYGSNPRILKSEHSPDEVYSSLWKTIMSGNVWKGLLHNKKKSGELYWESATIAPVTDKNGKITHFVASKEDVTEKLSFEESLVKSEEKYRILAEELGKTNATKDKLLSVISHDLRGPLGNFNEVLDIFSSLGDQDISMKNTLLKELKNESETLFEMLENLLQWSKIQQNAINLNPVYFPVGSSISEALRLYSDRALQKQQTVHYNDDSRYVAYADIGSVSLVIRNLLANAIKFTPRGGTIRITLKESEEKIIFSFQDTGTGIKEEVLKNLFNQNDFFRTYGTEGEKGRGIGLNLCKYFTEINNGELSVESTSGKGSIFTVSLPRS